MSIPDHQGRPDPMGEPRLAAKKLREVFAAKVHGLIDQGDIDAKGADELSRIATALCRLEAGSYDLLTAAVEVMDLFAEHVRREIDDEVQIDLVGSLIDSFFKHLSGQ